MPVSLEQIKAEKGRALEERILEFLARDPAQAYTSVEIALGVHGLHRAAAAFFAALVDKDKDELVAIVDPCQRALRELMDANRIVAHQYEGMTYFALPDL